MTDDMTIEPARKSADENDREFLAWLHRREPLHLMQLGEITGWIAPRKQRESFWYKLTALFGRSRVPGNARARRLEKEGSILGYRAVVDARLLDYSQVVFVQIALRDASRETQDAFVTAVNALSAVEACYMITGDFHYMLQVRTRDIDAFQDLLTDQITQIRGVARTATIIAMKTIKQG